MIDQKDIKIIQETTEEFLEKMTFMTTSIEVVKVIVESKEPARNAPATTSQILASADGEQNNNNEKISDVINLNIILEEPQILIGEKGQTLFEIQRLLRAIVTKKIQKIFYLNLDINNYKQSKAEYLKKISKELADEVSLTKEEKVLFPMPAHERRIIHAELTRRLDVITESRGEGADRRIVIKPVIQ